MTRSLKSRIFASVLGVLLVAAIPAQAVVAFVHYATGFTSSSPGTTTPSFVSTTGNMEVVAVTWTIATGMGCTNAASQSLTAIGSPVTDTAGNLMQLFYRYNITGNASEVITCTATGGTATAVNIDVYEFSGMGTSASLGTSSTGSGTGTTATTGAITVANPTGFGFGFVINLGPGACTSSAPYASGNQSYFGYAYTEYNINTGSSTPTATCANAAWEMISTPFNGPAAAGVNNQGMAMRGAQ